MSVSGSGRPTPSSGLPTASLITSHESLLEIKRFTSFSVCSPVTGAAVYDYYMCGDKIQLPLLLRALRRHPSPTPTAPRPHPTRPNLGVEVEIQDKWRRERMKRRKTRGKEAIRVEELCESRCVRPGLPLPMSLVVSVDVKQH